MSESVRTFLSTVDPFTKLPLSELDRLSSIAQEKQYEKGDAIYGEGDVADSIWVLISGRLEIFKYTSDGKPRAIESIAPRELFGTLCRIGGKGRNYPCTAVASVSSEALRLPDSVFLELFQRFPSVVTGVCSLCSQRLNMMQDLTCISQEPVEKRIVKTLLQLSQTHGAKLPFTKRQIGEFAATTVETTIRTLSEFQKKKWIESTRGQIILKDVSKLQSLLS